MTAEELNQFYEAALTASAILTGFIGTFLSFRIQREANYYRQPVLDFETQSARDVGIGLSRFPASLLLIGLAGITSTFFGVFWPLSALAHWNWFMSGPAPILAGITASIVLVVAYFFMEISHYDMWHISSAEWKREWSLAALGFIAALLASVITYCAVRHP